MKQLILDIIPAPAPTLANFVAGRNGELLAALAGLQEKTPAQARVIYVWGVPGSGKTHLSQACAGLGFAALRPPFSTAAIDAASACVVDQVDILDADSQHALFDLINRQQLSGGMLLATGNCAPRDLPLRRDLASRLGSGLVFQLQPLNDGEKVEALHAHARTRSFALREDVAAYLLRHGRRDMASLIQVLDRLDQYSLETGREITLPLLKEMTQPSLSETT
ncbi:MAG: DnaA regulatory inactivator Hda [Betaproteobacteria bacterium]